MKLLILTQKVDKNDSVLGFFHRWLEEFAKNFEYVTVICLELGEYDLPSNVKVLSLGKEMGQSRIKYLYRFYKYILQERKNYDSVFVHMNPEYVVFGGIIWRLLNKKIGFWYTHKSVTCSLCLAEKFSQLIFTASVESFRIKSKKIKVVGHGIDVYLFKPGIEEIAIRNKILMIGRISETKNQLNLLETFTEINKTFPDYILYFIGSVLTEADKIYENKIKDFLKNNIIKKRVVFCGSLNQAEVANYLSQARLLVNLSSTGSLDKDVLEALSCKVPVITSNKAFINLIPECVISSNKILRQRMMVELAKKEDGNSRDLIISSHSLLSLIPKIHKAYEI